MSIRVYELRDGFRSEGKLLCWGRSRFGNHDDKDVQNAVLKYTKPGDGFAFCITHIPEMPRVKTADAVQSQRIGNLKRRAKRLPLFADMIIEEEIGKERYSIEAARQTQEKRKNMYKRFIEKFWREHTPELEVKPSGE